jgi:hypothetical protein
LGPSSYGTRAETSVGHDAVLFAPEKLGKGMILESPSRGEFLPFP